MSKFEAFSKEPVYSIIAAAIGDAVKENDFYMLRQVEETNHVLLTVEGDVSQPIEFFEQHKDSFLFIQGGCRIMNYDNLNKDAVFFGVVLDPAGFVATTGRKMNAFYCPATETQTVPVWVYKGNDFTKRPVYSPIFEALGDHVRRCDIYELRQVEETNHVLLTVEGDVSRPIEFFEQHKDSFLFIQGGCRIMNYDNLNKDAIFFGVVLDPAGFVATTGRTMNDFYCSATKTQTVPVWVYNPYC